MDGESDNLTGLEANAIKSLLCCATFFGFFKINPHDVEKKI
jgi:hypothetical protein